MFDYIRHFKCVGLENSNSLIAWQALHPFLLILSRTKKSMRLEWLASGFLKQAKAFRSTDQEVSLGHFDD